MLYVSAFYFSATVAVVLTLFVMVMFTGAMHEDGLADTVDAFGGGYDSERILAIMKDSRTGAFGVIALILVFALKIAVLVEMLHIEIIDAVLALMGAGVDYYAADVPLRIEIEELIAEEGRVAAQVVMRAANARGEPYENQYHFAFHLEDGRITAIREYVDTRTAARFFGDG